MRNCLMNRDIDRPLLRVEAILGDFLLRGSLLPLGELMNFLNDRRRGNIAFESCELFPLAADRQVRGVRQESLTVVRDNLIALCLLDEAQMSHERLLKASRPVVFYTASFAIQGQLHVNVDARDTDLLDDSRDFYPVTQAMLFPLRPVAQAPTARVPLLLLQRSRIQAYHRQQ